MDTLITPSETSHLIYVFSLLFYFVLQGLDIHSTHRALTSSKNLSEGNPFVKSVMDRFGILKGLLIIKAPSFAIVWFVMQPVWLHIAILTLLCGFYSYIVSNNYKLAKNNK